MSNLASFANKIVKKFFFFLRPKLHYIALGDSTVVGIGASSQKFNYVSQLANLLKEDFTVKLVNLGKSGATCRDVVCEQLPEVLKHKPHLVTLSIGPNDIRKFKTLGEFRDNIELIFKLLGLTGAKIVINTIPDMSKLPSIPAPARWLVKKRVEQFNLVICKIAKDYGVLVCDLFGKSQQFGNAKDYIAEDGFHLSDLGYYLWAKFFYSDLKPLLVK